MTGFDVRAWNLFAAIAVALPACGDAGADAEVPGSTSEEDDDYYPPCGDAPEDASFRCIDYDTDDYGDGDGDGDGDYECSEHGHCGPGSVCMDGSCTFLSGPLPSCTEDPGLVESIPLPDETEGVIALSGIDRDGDGADELVADTADGLRLVDLVERSVEALPVEVTIGGHSAAAGAFDASTPHDVILVEGVTGQMSLLRNDGAGGWIGPEQVGASAGHVPIVPGDFDGDGHLDVCAGGFLRLGDGAGGFSEHQPLSPLVSWGPIVRIDADADDADELLGLQEDGTAAFWDGQWGAQPLEPDGCPLPATDLAAADVDGDGAADVVRLIDDGNAAVLSVFLAANGFAAPSHVGLAARHTRIAVGDLDGEGTPDVVGWGGPGGGVIVYWNLATATSCRTTTTASAIDLVVGDYDGDGRPQLAFTDGSRIGVLGVE